MSEIPKEESKKSVHSSGIEWILSCDAMLYNELYGMYLFYDEGEEREMRKKFVEFTSSSIEGVLRELIINKWVWKEKVEVMRGINGFVLCEILCVFGWQLMKYNFLKLKQG